jgi:NarL family two-component system sensor histidine kinase LiaS
MDSQAPTLLTKTKALLNVLWALATKQQTLDQQAAAKVIQHERQRISSELHDRVLQLLTGVKLRAETCRRELIGKPPDLERELHNIEQTVEGAIAEIRRLLADNQAQSDLIAGTLERRLKEELEIFRARSGMRLKFQCGIGAYSLTYPVERELYFALREGVLNAVRHSRASELELSLVQKGATCEAVLRDNGVGFDVAEPEGGAHYGLRGMRERIARVGGNLTIRSAPGQGTEISIGVPATGTTDLRKLSRL